MAMNQLPTAAEVREMASDIESIGVDCRGQDVAWSEKNYTRCCDAYFFLLQFAELLEQREEWTRRMAKAEDDIPGGIGVGGLLVDMGVKVNPEAE